MLKVWWQGKRSKKFFWLRLIPHLIHYYGYDILLLNITDLVEISIRKVQKTFKKQTMNKKIRHSMIKNFCILLRGEKSQRTIQAGCSQKVRVRTESYTRRNVGVTC